MYPWDSSHTVFLKWDQISILVPDQIQLSRSPVWLGAPQWVSRVAPAPVRCQPFDTVVHRAVWDSTCQEVSFLPLVAVPFHLPPTPRPLASPRAHLWTGLWWGSLDEAAVAVREAEGVIVIGDNACPMFTDRTTANVTDTLGHALVTAQQTDQQSCRRL